MGLSVKSIRNLFKKEYSSLITKDEYSPPKHRPTKWALLRGPYYKDKTFTGSLLIDLSKMHQWVNHHAENTWTNQTAEQNAKEYFVKWIEDVDLETDAITLLDKEQQSFLKSYALDFLKKDWHQIYCPNCNVLGKKIKTQKFDNESVGKKISWSDEWRCEQGHILYYEDQSIRLF
jgi:hypothetical protein